MDSVTAFLVSTVPLGGLFAGLAIVLMIAEKVLINYGTCQIDIDDGEKTLEVEGGQTLLSELLEAKVRIPNACAGKGTCGYCKVTVLEGGGKVLPTETPYLSRKEQRANVRLACQVKVRSDMKVKLVDFLETVKGMVEGGTYNKEANWTWSVPSPAQEAAEPVAPAAGEATEEDLAFLEKVAKDHEGRKGALIARLQAVNGHYRYLPDFALEHVAESAGVPFSQVFSLATFYNAFSLTPKGKCTIKVCVGTACHVKGAPRLLERLERELDIKEGQTTADLAFTLEGVRCLGCCGLAPVVTFDEEVHGRLKPAQLPKLVEAKRAEMAGAEPGRSA